LHSRSLDLNLKKMFIIGLTNAEPDVYGYYVIYTLGTIICCFLDVLDFLKDESSVRREYLYNLCIKFLVDEIVDEE
jgi:hypothetical protein